MQEPPSFSLLLEILFRDLPSFTLFALYRRSILDPACLSQSKTPMQLLESGRISSESQLSDGPVLCEVQTERLSGDRGQLSGATGRVNLD